MNCHFEQSEAEPQDPAQRAARYTRSFLELRTACRAVAEISYQQSEI